LRIPSSGFAQFADVSLARVVKRDWSGQEDADVTLPKVSFARPRSLAARARTWGSCRGSKASAFRLAFA
jgi:hypothetical protein